MSTTGKATLPRLQYHANAYDFVLAALRHTQKKLGRAGSRSQNEEQSHISGQELVEGIRHFACEHFGLMTLTVFNQWGIHTTEDFGRIVFELVDCGEMRKTERDQLQDFYDLYDFAEVFDHGYRIDVARCFAKPVPLT
jgi:uncharacterized repeat protein (TIGR04138 family)